MKAKELIEGALTRSIIGAFYEVYNTLDFGFLELVYKEALAKELLARGHRVDREVRVATDLEVGLLLHFGLEAKFYRVVELRSRKVRKSSLDTDLTDLTDSTDRSLSLEAPRSPDQEIDKSGGSAR